MITMIIIMIISSGITSQQMQIHPKECKRIQEELEKESHMFGVRYRVHCLETRESK